MLGKKMRQSNEVTASCLMGCDDGENKFVDLTCVLSILPRFICSVWHIP